MFRQPSCLRRHCRYLLGRASWRIVNWRDHWLDPSAESFFQAMNDGGFDPDALIDALPRYRLIYVCVPKSASTTIKSALSALEQGVAVAPALLHRRRCSGLKSPTHVGLANFHRLANSAGTLRFSFVRNPYARLVSAWADKFQGKPLKAGDSFTDDYRAHRAAIGDALPDGQHESLSFPQVVEFASEPTDRRVNTHWQLQDDLLDMPGIKLDLIGKLENIPRRFHPRAGSCRRCRPIAPSDRNSAGRVAAPALAGLL